MEQPSKFEGWAVVEMFGHQQIAGYVTTENYGSACLFRVDVPELPEREITLKRMRIIDGKVLTVGSKVKRQAEAAYSKLIGPGAVYSMNPRLPRLKTDFRATDSGEAVGENKGAVALLLHRP